MSIPFRFVFKKLATSPLRIYSFTQEAISYRQNGLYGHFAEATRAWGRMRARAVMGCACACDDRCARACDDECARACDDECARGSVLCPECPRKTPYPPSILSILCCPCPVSVCPFVFRGAVRAQPSGSAQTDLFVSSLPQLNIKLSIWRYRHSTMGSNGAEHLVIQTLHGGVEWF